MSQVINCVLYRQGEAIESLAIDAISEHVHQPGDFVWVGVHEPDDALMAKLREEFELHELAVEDALRAHQRPKLEEYGESLFVVLRPAVWNSEQHSIELAETHLFVGAHFLLSVRHGNVPGYATVRSRCESSPHLLRKGSSFALYAIMDHVVDSYFPIIDALEVEVEELETRLFSERFDRSATEQIYKLRSELIRFKRAVTPLIDVCNRLVRFDLDLISADTQAYFRDIYDHVIRIHDQIDVLRELLSGALEANLGLVSIQQNEATKSLASWAAIIGFPTLVAGVYGMNFETIPGANSPMGFTLCVVAMAVCCLLLYYRFRRVGWL